MALAAGAAAATAGFAGADASGMPRLMFVNLAVLAGNESPHARAIAFLKRMRLLPNQLLTWSSVMPHRSARASLSASVGYGSPMCDANHPSSMSLTASVKLPRFPLDAASRLARVKMTASHAVCFSRIRSDMKRAATLASAVSTSCSTMGRTNACSAMRPLTCCMKVAVHSSNFSRSSRYTVAIAWSRAVTKPPTRPVAAFPAMVVSPASASASPSRSDSLRSLPMPSSLISICAAPSSSVLPVCAPDGRVEWTALGAPFTPFSTLCCASGCDVTAGATSRCFRKKMSMLASSTPFSPLSRIGRDR
eukprot:Opistho-1_new@91687